MGDPSKTLWVLMTKVLEAKQTLEADVWHFKPGLALLRNPEMECPYCHRVIATNRVWLVNQSTWQIVNVWDLNGSPISNVAQTWHPHANSSGNLCKGAARNAIDMMFAGIDTSRQHYRHVPSWLYQMGHECPKFEKRECKLCHFVHPTFMSREYGNFYLCSSSECYDKVAKERCDRCFDYREIDERQWRGYYCVKCFNLLGKDCGHCKQKTLASKMRLVANIYICPDCYATGSGECSDCKKIAPFLGMSAIGYCTDCVRRACWSCCGTFKAKDLVGGKCAKCRPPRFPCRVCLEGEYLVKDSLCAKCECATCGAAVAKPGDEFCIKHRPYKCSCGVCSCHNPVLLKGAMCHTCVFDTCPGILIKEVEIDVQVPTGDNPGRGWRWFLANGVSGPRLRRQGIDAGLRRRHP